MNISTWNNFKDNIISAPIPFTLKPVAAREKESIPLQHSVGRIAAEMVTPYPPGIPLVYPGEMISSGICDRLTALSRAGAKFQAAADPSLGSIVVYNIRKGGEV